MKHQHPTATTRQRWAKLASELQTLATSDDFDASRERVGLLCCRECLALNVSTAWRESKDRHNAN